MAKPQGYFTEGKGADRKVHPVFEPKGQRITHSKFVHPSRDEVYDAHVQRRLQRIHSQRSLRAQRTDEALRATPAKTEQEWIKQPNRRDVKGVDYPKGRVKKAKTHTHWMVTPDGKYRERIEHPISQKHTNIYSQRRHSLETGAMQRWLKKRNLQMLDANKERYEQEVIVPIIKKEAKPKPKREISEYNLKRARSAQETIDRLKREGHPYRGLSPNHPEVKRMIARAELNKQLYEGKISKDEWNKRWNAIKAPKAKPPEPHMGGATSYNKATGWMRISFPDKPPEDVRAGMKSQGFRYKPRSKTWSAKWTPERQDYAEALVGKMETVDIKPNWAKKAENAAVLAQKHEGKSNEAYDRAHKKLGAIPFGQPILVGHHSEKRHRSDLRKINRLEKRGREESEVAEKYQRRAERYGRKATGEHPVTIHNRIKRLEADERKLRDRTDEHGKRWLEHTQERLLIEREKYEASGGIPADKLTINAGDRVKTRWGIGTVATVSKNTLRVKLDPDPISGRPVGIYENQRGESKLDKTDIYGRVES